MTITLTREEAKQVLDALECMNEGALNAEIKLLRARLAQPEQRTGDCLLTGVCAAEGHRIQKAQREWQGLTTAEVKVLWNATKKPGEFAAFLEARLKEKNA
jgi:hypothetical protein